MVMKFNKIIITLLIIPLFAFALHKYYISLCEIEYVEKKQSVQIIVGLFIDDLEIVLNKNNQTSLYLATSKEPKNIDNYYKEYLKKNLKFIINNTNTSYTYIGKEYDDNLVHFYLEIPNISKLESIEITNTCLFNYFEDQQNIVKLKINNYNKTFYLTKNNVKGLLKL